MASDSSDVDAAIIAALRADYGSPSAGTLGELCPDGVFVDVAPESATKFVIVSLVIGEDEPEFGGDAYERMLYLVKAVVKGSDGTTVKAAAQRIQTLLQFVDLWISGYDHMLTRRIERVRFTEVDDQDAAIRWQHRGGRYEVYVSPTGE